MHIRIAVAPLAIVTALGNLIQPLRPQPSPRESMLVSARWVHEHIRDPKLVVLHVGDRAEYQQAHLPGAQFISLEDVSTAHDPAPQARMLEMLSDEELRSRLVKFGITNDSRIIVYYGKDWVSPSTRVVLTLERAGLGGATSIMDGGMPAWVADGFATTTDVPAARAGKLAPLRIVPNTVDGAWVRANAMKPGYALIDARDGVFYDGINAGGPRGFQRKGHIPGAKSVPYTAVWTDRNTLKSPEELKEIFAKAGVKAGDTIVGYCHIGQQATAMLFAARSLGFKTVLYDGSFDDWALRDWPVEADTTRK